jgi:hypothetical protein
MSSTMPVQDPESAPELTNEPPTLSSFMKGDSNGDSNPETQTLSTTPTSDPTLDTTDVISTGSNPDKTSELLAVVDEQESKDQAPEVFSAAEDDGQYVGDVSEHEPEPVVADDDDDDAVSESEFFEGIQAPPEKNEDEKYDDDAPPAAMQQTTAAIEKAKAEAKLKQKQQAETESPPDFSKYTTNVAQRLWNAQQVAEKEGKNQSGELIRLLKEYQAYRKKVRNMIKAADDYQAALKNVTATRSKVRPYNTLQNTTSSYAHPKTLSCDSHCFIFSPSNLTVSPFSYHIHVCSSSVRMLTLPEEHRSGMPLVSR